MGFEELLNKYSWQEITERIYAKNENDVLNALNKSTRRNTEDFMALASPAAEKYLEEMAQLSSKLTKKRFGKTIQLYIPLYLSNACSNECVYCGFNRKNKIKRVILSDEEILREVEVLKKYGYEHLLLVTGENEKKVGADYFEHVMEMIKDHFSLISMEVQPMETEEYTRLIKHGLHSVYIYQETYNKEAYPKYHLAGKKADFEYRLNTPERLGEAGIHRIGLGNLIGLEDWRTEAFFTALHLRYLQKRFWRTKFSISFPRLRPHEGAFQPNVTIEDRQLVQLICAYRIFDEDLELSMSVRESPSFRDNIIHLGVTSMSAGSKTDPGGYSSSNHALKQFDEYDNRSPKEIEEMIKNQGFEAIWKDWDSYMHLT